MNSKITNPGNCAESDQNSAIANSSAEINRLSSELNSRLSRELDEMMGSVNTQIQRAISDAISNQILPQIQTALSAGSGHLTHNRWNVPSERPEFNLEEAYGEKVKKNTRCEQRNGYQSGSQPNLRAYDSTLVFHSYRTLQKLKPSKNAFSELALFFIFSTMY